MIDAPAEAEKVGGPGQGAEAARAGDCAMPWPPAKRRPAWKMLSRRLRTVVECLGQCFCSRPAAGKGRSRACQPVAYPAAEDHDTFELASEDTSVTLRFGAIALEVMDALEEVVECGSDKGVPLFSFSTISMPVEVTASYFMSDIEMNRSIWRRRDGGWFAASP